MLCIIAIPLNVAAKYKNIYSENFDNNLDWHLYEEIVNSCYSDSAASLELTNNVSYKGEKSLAIWSNKAETEFSNHVIAGKNILNYGVNGIWKYILRAYIPQNSFFNTQVGPEFSFQNTRTTIDGNTHTSIAGIQYITSKYISEKWNIWVGTSDTKAEWKSLSSITNLVLPELQADIWYTFKLKINYDINEYISLIIDNNNGNKQTYLLTGIPIAKEFRGFAPASVITLEGENLYNNCGLSGIFNSVLYYDNVKVKKLEASNE